MHELIEAIRVAVSTGATTEQKAAGVLACHTIAVALDTQPGKPLAPIGGAPAPTTTRLSIDQVLDLLIARLSMISTEHKQPQALPAPPAASSTAALPDTSRGLRVPVAQSNRLKVAPRPASARTVPPTTAPRSSNITRPVSPRKP